MVGRVPRLSGVLQRVRGEYREMPGMSLSLAQAERLFGLDQETCSAVLQALVATGYLHRTSTERYVRLDSNSVLGEDGPGSRPASASVLA